jgi:hypothetical protein
MTFTTFPVSHWAEDGIIKSVQTVQVTVTAGASGGNTTVTSVVRANTLEVYGGIISDNSLTENPSNDKGRIFLNSVSNVTMNRAGTTGNLTGYVTLVEFKDGVLRSKQAGSFDLSAAALDESRTITSVNVDNSFISFYGTYTTGTASDRGQSEIATEIVSPTSVRGFRDSSGITTTSRYTVYEFEPGILNQATQQVAVSTSANITTVDSNNSWLVYGGQEGPYNNSMSGRRTLKGYLQSDSVVAASATDGHGTGNWHGTVVEFKPQYVLQSSQRENTFAITSGATSRDLTVTPVDTSKSFVQYLGGSITQGTSDVANHCEGAVQLVDASTVRMLVGEPTSTSASFNASWDLISLK